MEEVRGCRERHIALWLLLLLLNFLLCSLWAEGAVRDKQGSTQCSKCSQAWSREGAGELLGTDSAWNQCQIQDARVGI